MPDYNKKKCLTNIKIILSIHSFGSFCSWSLAPCWFAPLLRMTSWWGATFLILGQSGNRVREKDQNKIHLPTTYYQWTIFSKFSNFPNVLSFLQISSSYDSINRPLCWWGQKLHDLIASPKSHLFVAWPIKDQRQILVFKVKIRKAKLQRH